MVLFSLSLLYGIPSFYKSSSVANATSQNSIGLTLVASPPILPADGGSYQALVLEFKNLTSGIPYVPASNLTIQLSSTNLQTATVPQSLVFPAGSLFETVNLTTTSSPGSTTVNAFVTGFTPASTSVTTELTGGMPAVLQVYMSPPVVPPNKLITSSVVVVVLDSLGNPVKLGTSLTVALSSSNSQVGSVPSSITIKAGASYGDAFFTPTYVAGQTVITASAAGLTAGSTVMNTVGPVARRLVVTVAPSIILDSGDYATVAVQLQDNSSSTPALAPSNVNVVVTSNSTGVATVSGSSLITISQGQSYALLNVTSGGSAGVANITASAQGYLKGSALLSADAVGAKPANRLSVSFLPNTLLPNNQVYSDAAVVELQYFNSATNIATPVSSPGVTVYTRSSNNATMAVNPAPMNIPSGQTHGFASITSTFLPGLAVITAQANGYSSDTESLTSFGLNPDALSISTGPKLLLADGESYNLTVGLINKESNNPAIASANTIVNLASTESVVGTILPTVTIQQGQSFATVTFISSGLPGVTQITATSSNAAATNATLSLINSQATNLAIYATPNVIIANGMMYSNLIVQLQDANHNPEKTDVPLNISLTSSSAHVSSQITVGTGQTFAQASFFSTTSPGQVNITAFRNGFEYAQTSITAIVLPLQAQMTFSAASIPLGGRATATVAVGASGQPLSGAAVVWQTNGGTLVGVQNSTNSAGKANTTLQGTTIPATIRVSAQISAPGYETVNVNSTIQVYNPTPPPQPPNSNSVFGIPFLGMPILGIPLWAIIVIAAGGAGGGFFYMKRIRGAAFQYQDEE
ncbi:MAG: hypothetical protein ACRECH_09760 [Nitrososphaerales archaeon]